MPDILAFYPEAHIYVGGQPPLPQTEAEKEKGISPYGVYISNLMRELDLENKVTFLGPLSEEAMAKQFLSSHVFVSASVIENSPNSVIEAAMLGVPVVSSYVGGVANMLKDKESALFFQSDAPYMLAYYVCSIFGDDALAASLSANASAHVVRAMEREAITQKIADVYRTIAEGKQ
jgi:glycosyltransferase involved in cell wall biosynthesis